MSTLTDTPADIAGTLALCDRLDSCFLSGFARLGSAQTDALAAVVAAFAGSPLEARLTEAMASIGRNQLVGDTFLSLAIARTALLGAVHDALLVHAAAGLGLGALPPDAPPAAVVPWSGPPANLAQAVRHWLVEVAIAGFARLESSALLPFSSTLERLLDDPASLRLATLLVGWHGELLSACPVPEADAVPLRRWADLWTRAMTLTVGTVHTQPVDTAGTLTPIGLEVRQHGHMTSLVGHALLGDQPVRIGLQAYKVDVIRGPEMFDLFKPRAEAVLAAFADGTTLEVTGSVSPGGELSIRTAAKAGRPVDTAALAGRLAATPTVARIPAADRHPMLFALPIGGTGSPAALGLRVEGWYDRSSTLSDKLGAVDHWVGLLRWDDGFFVQPLGAALRTGKKLDWQSNAAHAKTKPKTRGKPALDILRTKASKLLRGKS